MSKGNWMKYLNIGCTYRADNATDAWEYWYKELEEQHKNGFRDSSRDGDVVGEFINAITIITDPRNNIVKSDLRKLNLRYMIGELLWYNAADNTLAGIQNYTKAWDRMSDDGITVNSNYGHKIRKFYGFDQWEHVKNLLNSDQNSRQAVIHIKNPSQEKTKDTPCTICLQFFIRDNKLHLTVYMRSNDIWMGFPYDVFNFCCFQIQMAMELGVEIGCYTHISGSLHLYKRNSKYVEETPWIEELDKEVSEAFPIKEESVATVDKICECGSDCSCKRPEGLHRSI